MPEVRINQEKLTYEQRLLMVEFLKISLQNAVKTHASEPKAPVVKREYVGACYMNFVRKGGDIVSNIRQASRILGEFITGKNGEMADEIPVPKLTSVSRKYLGL